MNAKDGLNKDLKVVEKAIKLPNWSNENRKIAEDVLIEVMGRMKIKCEVFELLFEKITYQGSFFDHLRIKQATEFDLNVVLSFNRKLKIKLNFVSDGKPPGFGKIQMTKPENQRALVESLARKIKVLVDEDNYLLPVEINKLMQSTLAKAFDHSKPIQVEGVRRVDLSASGPARTLLIHTTDGQRIDIDLVPVLLFPESDFPKNLKIPNGVTFLSQHKVGYMVPKPYKQGLKQNPSEPLAKDIPRLWRMHFPDMERKILLDVKTAKPLIRILKFLRDGQDWKAIASYYLKTVVMLEVVKNNSKDYWNDVNMADRFLELLLKLKEYIEKGFLPYLLFPQYNLFNCIPSKQLENLKNRIIIIHKKVLNDPGTILEFCKVQPEMAMARLSL